MAFKYVVSAMLCLDTDFKKLFCLYALVWSRISDKPCYSFWAQITPFLVHHVTYFSDHLYFKILFHIPL